MDFVYYTSTEELQGQHGHLPGGQDNNGRESGFPPNTGGSNRLTTIPGGHSSSKSRRNQGQEGAARPVKEEVAWGGKTLLQRAVATVGVGCRPCHDTGKPVHQARTPRSVEARKKGYPAKAKQAEQHHRQVLPRH